jgi:hypothetical protein
MDYEFKDPLALARTVGIALIVWLVVATAYAGSSLNSVLTIEAFQRGAADLEALSGVDNISRIAAGTMVVVNLVTIVLVGRWIYRANKNAHAMSDSMVMTPGWNVGFFFIPIANLWKPFEGIRQAWRASVSPSDPENAEVPIWVNLWWTGWILSSILNNIIFRLSMNAVTLDDLHLVGWLEVACLPLDLLTGYTLYLLVTRLSRIQHDAFDADAQRAVFE